MVSTRSIVCAGIAEDVTFDIVALPHLYASRLHLFAGTREKHPVPPGRVRFILKEPAMPEARFAYDPQSEAQANRQSLQPRGDFVVGPLNLVRQVWHTHHAVQSIERATQSRMNAGAGHEPL